MNLTDLRARRANLITEARTMLDTADAESRDLSAEEDGRYRALMAEESRLSAQIDRETRQQELERSLATALPVTISNGTTSAATESRELLSYTVPGGETRTIYRDDAHANRATEPYNAAYRRWLLHGETRDLQADIDTAGGYTVAPQQFVARLIQAVDNQVLIRGLATVMTVTNADSLGVPVMDTDVADADWTTELATGSADTSLAFGKRELRPQPLAKRVLISNKLLRASAMDMEAFVRGRLAYKFGVSQEKVFMTGTGSGQPLGLFTASSSGISTGRDVSTGNTTTSMTFDGIQEARFTLKPQYWPRARWLFHRDAVKQLAKLKDGSGNYIWQIGNVQTGQPDRLFGLPVLMSEYAPNTFTTGLYTGMLADFSHYWIADALDMQMQRLVELYALTNQTALIGRMELDAMPVLEESFVRVKLA
ncbi:MAG: hypothetical protein POELPBGB_04071 [Bacteroidia bacterium]|nr:hypothetical protein [Bacteroidia bacterium]